MRLGDRAAVVVVLAVLAACGDLTPDVAAPATQPPESEPDIVGFVTDVAPFVPVTEDCAEPDPDADPDTSVSSDDPPVCTDPDTPILGSVLVEEEPSSISGDRKISFTVERDTTLLVERGVGYESVSFADLEEGQPVAAWSTGPIAESYPEQGEALAIVIREDS
ncbi:MAG: hypothetical protein ACRDWI_19380 [Jiangellaceae bacterium]